MRAVRGIPADGGGCSAHVVEVDRAPGISLPDAKPVELAVTAAGVCGSDLGYLAMGSTHLLGHELAGFGPDGRGYAVEAVFPCGRCDVCGSGHGNLCRTVHERVPGLTADGGMAQRYQVPHTSLVPLPNELPVADACLVEPAAVAHRAVRLAGTGPDSRVLVIGGGAVGLLAVAAAQALGAAEVVLTARRAARIEAGERLGATINASGPEALAAGSGPEYDVVIDAAGTPEALAQAVASAAPRGTLAIAALHGETLQLPFLGAFVKELRVVTSLAYGTDERGQRDVDRAAAMLAGRPEIADAVITHRFPLADASEAFRVAADRSTGAIKVVVEP